MKLHRIVIENLNSLYGKHEIDLDALLDGSSLFLIHGPTGSGKSTLMDAVSLALFGQTPRRNKHGSGDSNPQLTMSRGTGICHASVEFSKWKGARRERYRAVWTTRRARQKSDGKLQAPHRSLERLQDGDWVVVISGKKKQENEKAFREVLEDFKVDDFNRSMLLAQGQFDAFLSASSQERARLLERLTGTEHFLSIGERANAVHSLHQSRVAALSAQLQGERPMLPEEKRALEERTEAHRRELEALRGKQEGLRDHLHWLEELQRHSTQRQNAAQRFEAATAAFGARDADFVRLREHERCSAGGAFEARVRLDEAARDAQGLQEESRSLEERLPALRTAAAESQAAFEAASAEAETVEARLHALRPLGERAAAAEKAEAVARRSYDALAEEIAGHRRAALTAEEKHQAAVVSQGEARGRLETLRGEEPALEPGLLEGWQPLRDRLREERQGILLRRQHWEEWSAARRVAEAEAKRLRSERDAELASQAQARSALEAEFKEATEALGALLGTGELSERIEERRTEIQEAGAALRRLELANLRTLAWAEAQGREGEARRRRDRLDGPLAKATEDEATLTLRLRGAGEALELAQKGLRRTEDLAALMAQRHLLKDGEPCPLCGAEEHPYAGDGEGSLPLMAVREAEEDRKAAALRHQKADREAQEARNLVQRLRTQREAAAEYLIQAQGDSEEKRTLVGESFGETRELGPQAVELLEALGTEIAELREKAAKGEGQLQALEQAAAKAEGARRRQELQRAADAEAIKGFELRLAEIEAEAKVQERRGVVLREADARSQGAVEEFEAQLRALGAPDVPGAAEAKLEAWSAWGSAQVEAWQRWHRGLRDAEASLLLETQALQATAAVVAREKEALAGSEAKVEQRHKDLDAALEAKRTALGELRECWQSHGGEGQVPGATKLLEVEERRLQRLKEIQGEASVLAKHRTAEHRQALGQQEELQKQVVRAEDLWERRSGEFNRILGALGLKNAEELDARRLEAGEHRELSRLHRELSRLRDEAAGALAVQNQVCEAHRKSLPGDLFASDYHQSPAAEGLENSEPNLDEPEVLSRVLGQFRERVGPLREALSVAEEALSQSAAALNYQNKVEEQHAARRGELRQAEGDARVWATLHKLIGVRQGEVFQEFAQALNLRQLLDRANAHLARLTDRYLLHPLIVDGLPTLDFELADLWQAGVRVSVRSISGGERFLVSLALALGLSDFRSVRMPVETLLLDEGFGTLDQNTLATALSALSQLQEDGRQVGIISHVVGLAEAIPAQIQVVPTGGGRSRLAFR